MSEVLNPPVTTAVDDALHALDDALDRLAAAGLCGLGNQELTGAVQSLHRVACIAQAQSARLVAEVDARAAATELGATSTAAWLIWALRMHPGAARRAVRDARALHVDPARPLVPVADESAPGGLAVTRAAFADGAVSAEQVSEIVSALDALPPGIDAETRARGEAFLVGQARSHGPHQLTRMGKHLLHTLDPDGPHRLELAENAQREHRGLAITRRRAGGFRLRGDLDDELGATLLTVLDPLAAPRPASPGDRVRDTRSVARRYADALADALQIVLGSGRLPTQGGVRPTVVVTIELDALRRRLGAAGGDLRFAGPVTAETVRRMCCDAGIIPIVLGANGEPLDVGRLSYPVTLAIRRALEARDGGCAFPGCDRPPTWCAAHHNVHWEHGGPTSIANTVLLCDRHHITVHHHGWTVRIAATGLPEFTPPPWIDPHQVPISRPWRPTLAQVRPPPPHPPRRC